jgi:hypothetical protein
MEKQNATFRQQFRQLQPGAYPKFRNTSSPKRSNLFWEAAIELHPLAAAITRSFFSSHVLVFGLEK